MIENDSIPLLSLNSMNSTETLQSELIGVKNYSRNVEPAASFEIVHYPVNTAKGALLE